ncbi:MAG: glycoside hydrolase family 28 protein [Prevotella sp.]|jgi:polygalacturonase|nr:glycoside hydrolase family 28 protein [Prevotella sp.]
MKALFLPEMKYIAESENDTRANLPNKVKRPAPPFFDKYGIILKKRIMNKREFILSLLIAVFSITGNASEDKKFELMVQSKNYILQQYNIKDFGAVDSKTEYSTGAVQAAVDKASVAGGGRVYVPAGTYLISPIKLRSNVELYLEEGATLLGTTDRTKYNIPEEKNYNLAGERGLIWAEGASNISIRGKGAIDGQGEAVAEHTGRLVAEGVITDRNGSAIKKYVEDGNTKFLREFPRPQEENRPMLIALYDCKDVVLDGIHIKNAATWVTTLWRCDNAKLINLTVRSRAFWNNDGIDIIDCTNTLVKNCDIDSADDGICLKSHMRDYLCENITIENCTVSSSASAIKFGTASEGGFRNITVRNITVKDTFRSAVAIESVDGGIAENITISDIRATNTWNAIFLIAGTRKGTSTAKNVTFENIYCEIPASKPDAVHANYTVPDRKRNLYPSLITGSPASDIENVKIKNFQLVIAGGGTTNIANSAVSHLPEMDGRYGRYPEYDMFGELPAWGLLCRNVKGLLLENIKLQLEQADYRNPVVMDNISDIMIKKLEVINEQKTPVILNNSSAASIKDIKSQANTSGKMYEVYNNEK